MQANTELELAYNFIQQTNRNLFLTGKAGTGKTTFLHRIKEECLKRMVIVAPTGVAAINAKGVTIHSFFQLPFGPILPNTSQQNSTIQRRFNKTKINIIRSLDMVVIDEVSMVRADVLDGIDEVLRRYKDRNKPFGGAQLLMIGDVQQLSPVVRQNEWSLLQQHYATPYFFSSKVFAEANVVSVELKHIYRQQNEDFIRILNEIRDDKLSDQSARILNKQYQPDFSPSKEDGYITLTTHNNRAKAINEKELGKIKSRTHIYSAKFWGNFSENNYPNDENLELKKGAQVMFIKNDSSIEKRYYNGKIGTIISLMNDKVTVDCGKGDVIETVPETWDNIKYSLDSTSQEISEKVEGAFTQMPLRLAWAITIHKSQGLTFEKAIIDAESSFAHGQAYVALSRCKSLEGVVLKSPIKKESIISDNTVKSFTKTVEENAPDEQILNTSKKNYQLNLIIELFDYYQFTYPLSRLIDIYYNNKTTFTGNIIAPLLAIKDKGVVPLLGVASKFKSQLQELSEMVDEPDNDEAIQERFKKALDYFKIQTEEAISKQLSELSFATDNKQVGKDFEKQLSILEEALQVKKTLLNEMDSRFSTKNYLKVRAKAVLEPGKEKPKKQREEVTSTQHKELFEALRMYRTSVSNSSDVPPFQIFTQKTLFEMCELLPATQKELKKVNGMGKIRVEKYGEEILDIINKYAKKNDLQSKVETVEIVKDKRNTKEVSFDYFKEGVTINDIAEKRGLSPNTIETHLAYYVETGDLDIHKIIPKAKVDKGLKFIKDNTFDGLSELRKITGDTFSFGELRMLVNYSKQLA